VFITSVFIDVVVIIALFIFIDESVAAFCVRVGVTGSVIATSWHYGKH
jgi:hypothetical protein